MTPEEKRISVRTDMIRYGIGYEWLVSQLDKWEKNHTDASTLCLAITGKRKSERYQELVELCDRVLTRYGQMYGDVKPA